MLSHPLMCSYLRDTTLARSCSWYSDDAADRFRQPVGVDYLIDTNLAPRPLAPLGPYSPPLSYISTRESEGLYYLGPQPRAVGLQIGAIERDRTRGVLLDLLDKRSDAESLNKSHSFLQPEQFAAYHSQNGEDLIGAGAITVFPGRWLVWRHDLAAKNWKWQRLFDQRVLLLLSIVIHKAILVGLEDGTVELINAETGDTLDQVKLSIAGIPSLPMEGCLTDGKCVIVTLDGRLVFLAVE